MERQALEARLDGLRRARGAAMLDGRRADHNAIAAVEADLAALQDAEGERARRGRAGAARARAARLESLRADLEKQEQSRLEAVGRAEKAARDLVAALDDVLAVTADMARTSYSITGKSVPTAINRNEVVARLSRRLSSVLGTIKGHRQHFGSVSWHANWYAPGDSWTEGEAAAVGPHIKPIIGKE